MTDCYRKNFERGLWYEIKCIENTIRRKLARGADASFEQDILTGYRHYAKVSGYKSKALDKDYHFNAAGFAALTAADDTAADNSGLVGIMLHPGRPPKAPDEPVSRMTLWRRTKKEGQGVLL